MLSLIVYDYITEPLDIVKLLDTDAKFLEWLDDGDVSDLEATLSDFEAFELYEYCELIKNVLERKKIIEEIDES